MYQLQHPLPFSPFLSLLLIPEKERIFQIPYRSLPAIHIFSLNYLAKCATMKLYRWINVLIPERGDFMPGFTTHYILGMKAYNDLPLNQLKFIIAKYRWLYQLGLQGPDMFF